MADIMDYWNGAGYGQIPEQQSPYTSTGYQPTTTPWANANTYAPNFKSPGVSYSTGTGMYADEFKDPLTYLGLGNPFAQDMWSLDNWGFGKRPKVKAPNVTWPSYQGTPFTPAEGLPSYYSPSQETQNQTQQQLYTQQQAQQGQQQNSLMSSLQNALSSQGQGYDYNYGGGQPNYVGQQETQYGSYYGSMPNSIYNTFKPAM